MEIHTLVKDNKSIVLPFLETLNEEEIKKTHSLLKKIPISNVQKFKKLPYKNTNVYEIKPTKQIRLLCFYHGKGKLVITHGIKKKSRKIPIRDIEKADNFRKEIQS